MERPAKKNRAAQAASLALAACLAAGTATPAAAASYSGSGLDSTTTATISVSGVEAGCGVHAYLVAEIDFDYTVDQGVDPLYFWAGELNEDVVALVEGGTSYTVTSDDPVSVATWVYLNYPDYIGYDTSGDVTDVSVSEITDAFAGEYYEEGESVTENSAGISEAELAGFYDDLAAAIRAGLVDVGSDGSYEATADSDGECELSVAQGIYVVITDNGVEYVHKVSSVNVVPVWDEDAGEWVLYDQELEVKKTPIAISKEITSYDEDGSAQADAAGVGDTVSYRIESSVPGYPASALSRLYYISDTLPTALTLDASSIKVYGAFSASADLSDGEEAELLSEGEDYELVTSVDDARTSASTSQDSFTVKFTYDSTSGADADGDYDDEGECDLYDRIDQYAYIVVVYDAVVNVAADAGTAYANDASVTWSNSPYTYASSTDTDADDPLVFTYGIDLTKTNTAGDELLGGAAFRIYDSDMNILYFVDEGDGRYVLAYTDEGGEYTDGEQTTDDDVVSYTTGSDTSLQAASGTATTNTVVTASDGTLRIDGLDTGTYYIVETEAPDGYNKIGYAVEVVITGGTDADSGLLDGSALLSGLFTNAEADEDGRVDVTLTDTKGFQLPKTGGTGTLLLVAAGAGLIALAAWLASRSRRIARAGRE